MKKFVSIVIPAYNSELSIVRAIDSCLNQTHDAVEIIAINDGSIDGTLNKLESYGSKIVVINQENQGVSAARNAGIKKANGTYVYFLDADDYFEKNALELMVREMVQQSADLVISGYKIYSGVELSQTVLPQPESSLSAIDNFMLDKIVSSPWAKLFKLEVIRNKKIIFESLDIMEDGVFNLNYIQYSNNTCFLNKALYCYDKGSEGLSSNVNMDKVKAIFESLKMQGDIYSEYCKKNGFSISQNILDARLFRLGILFPLSSGANSKILVEKLNHFNVDRIISNKMLKFHEKILLLSLKIDIKVFKLSSLLLGTIKQLVKLIKQ